MMDDGTHDLPPGKIAAVVTYLEMALPVARPVVAEEAAGPARLDPLGADLDRFRTLFRAIGEDWLWFSRLRLSDEALAAIIAHPAVEAFALVAGGRDVGLLELDYREPGECEIAFFGLVPEVVGSGLGRFMMERAIELAGARAGIRRLWLHTCTLDHPNALPFYRRMGFAPCKRAIEITTDPRLDGTLPGDAAPSIPLIR